MDTSHEQLPDSDRPRRYSPLAEQVNGEAQALAATVGSAKVQGEHFLAALLSMSATGALTALHRAGVDIEALRARVNEAVSPTSGKPAKVRDFSKIGSEAQSINRSARIAASRENADRLETVHMLYGIISESATAAKCLNENGLSKEQLSSTIAAGGVSD